MSVIKAVDLIRQSRNTVVLTGAGMSTASGIPDFRSRSNGLWNKDDPMEVASLTAFRQHPEKFDNWIRPLVKNMVSAKPNPGHIALTQLEEAGYVKNVITQNIDGLHQRAGSASVHEIHGSLESLTCESCFRKYEADSFMQPFIEDGTIPVCTDCGGSLKPGAILFGEQLPVKRWKACQKAAREADIMLIVGSSLEVMPVAGLPLETLKTDGKLIIINHSATYLDDRSAVVIHEDAAKILPLIADGLL